MVTPGAKKPSRLDAAAQEALRARHEALTLVEECFHDFDVVWAKVHGFPWWPGVLFHSWDVVRHAGIRTDPKIVAELVVPPPEKVATLDANTGQETGNFRIKRHCLIMFLDKFNFSLLEIDASNVASYTSHYHMYERAILGSKSSKWSKKKAEFRRALVKAAQLLHMGNEYTDDDLVLLEAPRPVEKKPRKGDVIKFERHEERDAWAKDKEKIDEDAGFWIKNETYKDTVRKERRRKKSPKAMARRETMAQVEDMEDDDEVMMVVPTKSLRKASSKHSRSKTWTLSPREDDYAPHVAIVSRSSSPIDLTETLEKKPRTICNEKAGVKGTGRPSTMRKKKMSGMVDGMEGKSRRNDRANVKVIEDSDKMAKEVTEKHDEEDLDGVADLSEEQPNSLMPTPLSSIWTTGVSDDLKTGDHTQVAYKQDFVWDNAVFTDELSIAEKMKIEVERRQVEDAIAGRERLLGKRQSRSVQQSHIRQNLMTGNLDPHTMVQCAAYRPNDCVDDRNSRSRGGPTLDPPFQVVIHPDAVFVADLHAHLATCEIIGFLGGKWDEASKTLYIQAAFPCRSLVIDGDDGSTDVEMDPGSEIELRGIIESARLEVVGWYHSHPAFAPDPSVRDIENQSSYQQLFQRSSTNKDGGTERKPLEPFVGLIIGTYDTRRNTPVSLFRYFHTRGEKVSGGACREISMPYEFIPRRRHFRSVLQDEEREKARLFPMYYAVLQYFKFGLTAIHLQVPVDIKATSTQRAMSTISPTRAKLHGPIGKRKQIADGAGNKPMKKARARGRRSVRPSSASENQIDLTGDDDNQKLQGIEDGTLMPQDAVETGHNASTSVISKEVITILDDVGKAEKADAIIASSDVVEDQSESSIMLIETLKSEAHSVDSQVAEVSVDFVESTEATDSNENGHNLPKEPQDSKEPQDFHENLASTRETECDQVPTENDAPDASTESQNVKQLVSSDSNGPAEVLDVNAIAEPSNACIPQASSASSACAVAPSMPLSASVSVSSRKRTRKPNKTTKHSTRSTSPSCDRVSPGMSPCSTNVPGQTFYDAFRPSGPRFANGGPSEGVTVPSSRNDGPKGDKLLEDAKYIVCDETMGITLSSHGGGLSAKAKDEGSPQVVKTALDDGINQEVRSFVTCLVTNVVKQVVLEISASTIVSTQERRDNASLSLVEVVGESSGRSTDKAAGDDVANVVMESTSSKSALIRAVDADGTAIDTDLQLFGSNGECEDIQTSLQKMADHLDKLKASHPARPIEASAKALNESKVEVESEHVGVKSESEEGDLMVEQDHLAALRTKYGTGVSRCAEQVITLVDYYRDFERRTDLNEMWKARTTKLEKIESSLSEYVQYLNVPVALRRDFVKDVISYLRKSWTTKDRRR